MHALTIFFRRQHTQSCIHSFLLYRMTRLLGAEGLELKYNQTSCPAVGLNQSLSDLLINLSRSRPQSHSLFLTCNFTRIFKPLTHTPMMVMEKTIFLLALVMELKMSELYALAVDSNYLTLIYLCIYCLFW